MSDDDVSSDRKSDIKEEPGYLDSSMNDDVEPPTFGPAALGLHRVGTVLPPKPQPTQPIQVLNARGMPARIRKKNKLFFDDELVNDHRALGSPRKTVKPSPVKTPLPTKVLKKRKGVVSKYMKKEEKISAPASPVPRVIPADKKLGQQIGLRLRNLLKLPKAHKWVIFEWFYSYIDKSLFDGLNDFQICLQKYFPHLKTNMLSKKEWKRIRLLMGKPRRCSQAFFNEERRELEKRRQKIRFLQNKKFVDSCFIEDLPNEIPLPLPLGTKVTARLRQPQDGIFTGTIDAVDSLTSKYRIKFDRFGLGTHSIPDYEIVANDFNETIPLFSLIMRPRLGINGSLLATPPKVRSILNKIDPLLGQDVCQNQFKNPVLARETIGGYPIKLLELIVRTKKTIALKHLKIERLREMNNEAELHCYADTLSDDFQRRFASIILSLEKINKDLQEYLTKLHSLLHQITKEPHIQAMLSPSYLREKCRQKAEEMVHRNNINNVTDEKVLNLIKNLTTVLLVANNLSSESNNNALKVFDGCIEEVKQNLHADNIEVFQKTVQIHLHHIQLGVNQMSSKSVKTEYFHDDIDL